jgi:hypothetical protein
VNSSDRKFATMLSGRCIAAGQIDVIVPELRSKPWTRG